MRGVLVGLFVIVSWGPGQGPVVVSVRDEVLQPGVKRLGMNVGSRTWWGASQLLKNLVDNPGFEAGHFAMVSHAEQGATANRWPRDFWSTTWNNPANGVGHPVGFWDGAEFEILYGPDAGRTGAVTSFTHENGRGVFYLDGQGNTPNRWDVMVTRRSVPAVLGSGESWSAAPNVSRPGSSGSQALRITSPPQSWRTAWNQPLDALAGSDPSAGKMLVVEGNWRISFWARAAAPQTSLRVRLQRLNLVPFLDQTITVGTTWQQYVLDFTVPPGTDPSTSPPGTAHALIQLALLMPVQGQEIWVDDMFCGSVDDQNPTGFRDAYVDRLLELQPGVLRYWGSQFGTSFAFEVADEYGRGRNEYAPDTQWVRRWNYGLHEFLELCAHVGAEPWYVIPPTWTAAELQGLVEYLAGTADGSTPWADHRASRGQVAPWTTVFPELHLEYGNELWGAGGGTDPFAGASLLGGVRLGAIANDRLQIVRAAPDFDPARMNLVIGGQAQAPYTQFQIEDNSTQHDAIALAPYYGGLAQWATIEEMILPHYAGGPADIAPGGRVDDAWNYMLASGQGSRLMVYENNFHTTGGTIPLGVRNDLVTSVAGSSLAFRSLLLLRAYGAREQCAFTSLQYSFRIDNGDYVRLFGTLRDLVTGRKRPTWLSLELANRAMRGDMTAVDVSGSPCWHQAPINGPVAPLTVPYVHAFAFREGAERGLVLFNLDLSSAHDVRLLLSTPPGSTATRHDLVSSDILDDNEDAVAVTLQTSTISGFGANRVLTIQPHGMTVITWTDAAGPTLDAAPGVDATAPGTLTVNGTGLDTVASADLGGAAAAIVAQSATSITLQPATSVPGASVLSVTDGAGATSAVPVARFPVLSARDACQGAVARFEVDAGGPGTFLLGLAAQIQPPATTSGVAHGLELQLGSMFVYPPQPLPASGPGVVTQPVPTAPSLTGLPLHFQALSLRASPGGAGATSYTNRLTIVL